MSQGEAEHRPGLRLARTEEDTPALDALADRLGGRVGLAGILGGLDRRGRRSWAPGFAVRRAVTWDKIDRLDLRWFPQGITSSADATVEETVEGRRLLLVSWYARVLPDDPEGARSHGVRISFLDLGTRRYTHALVVEPSATDPRGFAPLEAHAGGIVWHHELLHIAATARGLHTCALEDALAVDPTTASGCRFVLPVRYAYRPSTAKGHAQLRYSFVSLDRTSPTPALVVGEYGGAEQTRRLARYDVDPDTRLLTVGDDGLSRPVVVDDGGVVHTQGAVAAHGRWYLTVSRSERRLGTVYAGVPGAFRRYRWATPMGPEDLTWWPSTDLLWSVTEHPRRRWVFAMRRKRFD